MEFSERRNPLRNISPDRRRSPRRACREQGERAAPLAGESHGSLPRKRLSVAHRWRARLAKRCRGAFLGLSGTAWNESVSLYRSARKSWTRTARAIAPSGGRCSKRSARRGGPTIRCSCGPMDCWWVTLKPRIFERALAGMAAREVNARWQADMAEFFASGGGEPADRAMMRIEEVFHLD